MTNFTLHEYKVKLEKTYQVIDFINLNEFINPSDLYDRISLCKKDCFANNERIIFVYSNNKMSYLLEVLEHIDIPKFFIIILQPYDIKNNIDEVKVLYYNKLESDLINNKKFDIPENHCIYPWINFQIDTVGYITPCCIFVPKEKNLSIHTKNLKENYLSSEIQMYRKSFQNNNKLTECSSCWKIESSGGVSMRNRAKHKMKDLYYKIDYSTDDISNLKMLDLKLGIKCNLKCRICNEINSEKILDFKLLTKDISVQTANTIKKLSSWSESDDVYKQILELAPQLTYLDIYGGEPFMNKPHLKFLENLIKLNLSSNISIDYNSNGTFYSEKFLKLWNKFKKVKVSFSIDDIAERFETQRDGANWNEVQDNIRKFNSQTHQSFITDVYITVSALNVYYLPELIEWIHNENFTEGFSLNMVSEKDILCISNLPKKVKDKVNEKLSYYPNLTSVINYMYNTPTYDKNIVEYIRQSNEKRQLDYFTTHKEFAKILINYS